MISWLQDLQARGRRHLLFKYFEGLEFRAPVTIFVGENGTGKSTLYIR